MTMFATIAQHILDGEYARVAQAILLALCSLAIWVWSRRPASTQWIPKVGKTYSGWCSLGQAKLDFMKDGAEMVAEGYRKHKDSVFKVQTADMQRIVLSTKYVDELRAAPESLLSVREGMCERHLGGYTTLDVIKTSHLQREVCRVQLTQNIHRLMAPMHAEANYWISRQISRNILNDLTQVKGYETVLNIVTGITSRVMVGLPTGRSQEWLAIAKGYTVDVMSVAMDLRPYPAFLRPFVYPWLESVKRLQGHVQRARQFLRPVFADRMTATIAQSIEEMPLDMAQWMIESARGSDRNPDVLTLKMLFLTLASVHTSSMSVTHALFDLCARPEYAQPLRKELVEVIGKYGWTREGIYNLKRLDSFLKESQRMNHPGLLSFNRKVMQDLRLSDGTLIPAKSFITMATSSVARDPTIYSNPDKFDGFRFYKKRMASPGEANRHQFVSTGPESLAFGYGTFACPGRFFAAALAKLVIGELLLRFDMSFPDGQTKRPKNVIQGESISPDRSQFITLSPRVESDMV